MFARQRIKKDWYLESAGMPADKQEKTHLLLFLHLAKGLSEMSLGQSSQVSPS